MSLTSKLVGSFPDKEFISILKRVNIDKDEFYTISKKVAFSKEYSLIIPNKLINAKESGMVGTAFDYLARFIVAQRLKDASQVVYTDIIAEKGLVFIGVEVEDDKLYEKFQSKFRCSIEIISDYVSGSNIEISDDLINSACYLARLDSVARAHCFLRDVDSFPLEQESEDIIHELRELINLFIKVFVHGGIVKEDSIVVFNPEFGECSKACGGADADIFIDGILYDFKCTVRNGYRWRDVAQLTGYYLFNEIGKVNKSDQFIIKEYAIENLALYKARYGEIEVFDIDRLNVTKKNIAINSLIEHLGINDVDLLQIDENERKILEDIENNKNRLSGIRRACNCCNKEKAIEEFQKAGKNRRGEQRYTLKCKKCIAK